VRELDIGDDQVGAEVERLLKRESAVGDRPRLVPMRGEEFSEQFDVQRFVLDDQDLGQTELPKL
jgi:hypothetical protein